MKRYQTQWIGQFGVATELTRRGYMVTFTLGNAPQTDLLVATPTSKGFTLEIKSQSTKNFWRLHEPIVIEDNFYIFVFIPENFELLKYYIMTSHEIYTEYHAYMKETLMWWTATGGLIGLPCFLMKTNGINYRKPITST